MQKLQWASARVFFMMMILVSAVTGNLIGYLLGPLYTWYFFNDFNCFKYYRYSYAMIACYWKMILAWLQEPSYRKMFAIPLTAPPLMAPDPCRAAIRADWRGDRGTCNGCVLCCARRACPLLDPETNHCRSYGSFYWRYFNCGRYPERIEQIMYYRCEKWEIADAPEE